MASSYKEGLANFVSWAVARRDMDQVAAWFSSDGTVLIEKPPSPPPAGYLPPDVFTYDTLDKTKMESTAGFGDPAINARYGAWKLSNLPAKVIIHNENIISLVLYFRAAATPNGFDEVMDAFKAVNPRTYRVSTSAWAQMIDELSFEMLPRPSDRAKLGKASIPGAMLTMALTTAKSTPRTRAHIWPANMPSPTAMARTPRIRWAQPHAV